MWIHQDVSNEWYSAPLITTDFLQDVPSISNAAESLILPVLSSLVPCSMQYIAEHGIGSILVFECLYFLLQTRNAGHGLQEQLDLAVEIYQSSGVHAKVSKLIQEAFEKYGEEEEILCPILQRY
ncbi:hypothetical protein BKA83DRAFT_4125201 [Pisolithus microcarpus]|nr:hypothetical protein BKA83DRAFT_4125201 [Pisolithus microcarpus]